MTASLSVGLAFSQTAELPFREAQQNAVSQPIPEYPRLAQQAQVSGLVIFRVSIDKQGHVASFELESGHPLLLAGTSEAIRAWRYKPFKLADGSPRDVTIRIGLRFDASAGSVKVSEPPAVGENLLAAREAPVHGTSEPFTVEASVLEEHNRQRKLPKYPEEAKSRKTEGTVHMRVTIARNGNVTEAVAVSGPPALQTVATEALRQWRYSPFLHSGAPVQVSGDAYLTFTLNPDAQMPVFPGDEIDALLDAAEMTVRDLKLEKTEQYCFTAMRRASESGPNHAHTIREALEILYELYSRTANANSEQREDVCKRWVSATARYEVPAGQWNARALADLGIYYASAQRYSEAESVYAKALDALANCIDPDGVRICTELQGDILGYRGLAAYAQGKAVESLSYFERATERPDGAIHPELKLILLVVYSQALDQLGRHQEAHILAQRAADYKTAHPDIARRAGMGK